MVLMPQIWLYKKYVFLRASPHQAAETEISERPLCYWSTLVTTNVPIVQAQVFLWNPWRCIIFAWVQPSGVYCSWGPVCRFPQLGLSPGSAPNSLGFQGLQCPPDPHPIHTPFCLQDTQFSSRSSVFHKSWEDRSLATLALGKCPWGRKTDGEALFLEWQERKDREQNINSSLSFLSFHNSKKAKLKLISWYIILWLKCWKQNTKVSLHCLVSNPLPKLALSEFWCALCCLYSSLLDIWL